MSYYKTVKTIQNCLYNYDVPTDLYDIFFDYYGDINESVDDLNNKHCFKIITCSSFVRRVRGYYCCICNNFLEVKSTKQLKRHIRSKEHCLNLEYDYDFSTSITDDDIKRFCADKWFKGMKRIPKKFKKNFCDDLNVEQIVIDFKKQVKN